MNKFKKWIIFPFNLLVALPLLCTGFDSVFAVDMDEMLKASSAGASEAKASGPRTAMSKRVADQKPVAKHLPEVEQKPLTGVLSLFGRGASTNTHTGACTREGQVAIVPEGKKTKKRHIKVSYSDEFLDESDGDVKGVSNSSTKSFPFGQLPLGAVCSSDSLDGLMVRQGQLPPMVHPDEGSQKSSVSFGHSSSRLAALEAEMKELSLQEKILEQRLRVQELQRRADESRKLPAIEFGSPDAKSCSVVISPSTIRTSISPPMEDLSSALVVRNPYSIMSPSNLRLMPVCKDMSAAFAVAEQRRYYSAIQALLGDFEFAMRVEGLSSRARQVILALEELMSKLDSYLRYFEQNMDSCDKGTFSPMIKRLFDKPVMVFGHLQSDDLTPTSVKSFLSNLVEKLLKIRDGLLTEGGKE